MNELLTRFKTEAEKNPLLALAVGAGFITAVAKLIDAVGSVRSKNAYATTRRIKKEK